MGSFSGQARVLYFWQIFLSKSNYYIKRSYSSCKTLNCIQKTVFSSWFDVGIFAWRLETSQARIKEKKPSNVTQYTKCLECFLYENLVINIVSMYIVAQLCNLQIVIIIQKANYQIKGRATRAPDKCIGRIMWRLSMGIWRYCFPKYLSFLFSILVDSSLNKSLPIWILSQL